MGEDVLQDLAKRLEDERKLLGDQFDERPLDIIVHSRGGLVARAFVELIEGGVWHELVRNVIFLGTPNAGTQLANPKNFGRLADFLVNLAHRDELFGAAAGLLANLAVAQFVGAKMPDIPGPFAQNPETLNDGKSLLYGLHRTETSVFSATGFKPDAPRYWCVSANYEPYEPGRGLFDLATVVKRPDLLALDAAIDAFYGVTNDLVVDTHGVWAFRRPSQDAKWSTDPIPPGRVLLFNPDEETPEPQSVQLYRHARAWHCNLFQLTETRRFVRDAVLA